MARSSQKERWYASMRKKLGVKTNEEVRAHMRNQGKKSHNTNGGFKHMAEHNPERLKQISSEAAKKRHAVKKAITGQDNS